MFRYILVEKILCNIIDSIHITALIPDIFAFTVVFIFAMLCIIMALFCFFVIVSDAINQTADWSIESAMSYALRKYADYAQEIDFDGKAMDEILIIMTILGMCAYFID